uniref:Sushi domain-containing protein n=1 Tax=Meleagris gallopavo TaxID=9103 RepID=A0A803XPJ1_MELGA
MAPRRTAQNSGMRCGRPKDVANAIIDASDTELLHTSLRYSCKLGYKRKAGTSTLIQCVLDHGKPVWTSTELQCIRKWSSFTFLPAGTSTTSAAVPVPSPETPVPPAVLEPPEMPTPGEGTALGITPLPTIPTDHAAGEEITHCVSIAKGSFSFSIHFFPFSPTFK